MAVSFGEKRIVAKRMNLPEVIRPPTIFIPRMILSENRLPLFGIMLDKASAPIWFKSRPAAITFRRNSEW
ncbi:MAG: hypothetical protein WBE48_15890, partial [Xanthobacteraceae bacterium]